MTKIKDITAREILDSSGQPTIEVRVNLDQGIKAVASSPSDDYCGKYEMKELRDGDQSRYQGLGVLKAVSQVKEIISPALQGLDVSDQRLIDKTLASLDNSSDYSNLGVNTVFAVSVAVARAAALSKKEELFTYLNRSFSLPKPKLPIPIFSVFNGGSLADSNLDFQEYLIIPKKKTFTEMFHLGQQIFFELALVLKEAGYDTDTGPEGAYAPDLDSSIKALELIQAASLRAGYKMGSNLYFGLNIGSSMLYDQSSKKYVFSLDQNQFSFNNLLGLYNEWLKKFPLIYLEDAIADDAWDEWQELSLELGQKMLISGGDLFVSSTKRLAQGLEKKVANSIVIKPGQAATVTETIACLQLARANDYKLIISQRHRETLDDFIVDLAVASAADYIKAGPLMRGERIVKYNRLLEIDALLK